MKLQVLLLAFAVFIASVHCQAQAQLGQSHKSPVIKGQVLLSRQQGRSCNCSGRRNGLELNCPCELHRQHRVLSQKQWALCQKKLIQTYKKCQQMIFGEKRKEKKGNKGISNPI
ncbi:uncharacterized protein zgc:158701 [Myxocyprinus asiaticus]|uniref:uncharacterized protein zgc:158701 n=1 Tax=Myxocyprinus asiaticus TaxID=70543 RepID=UPI0022218A50|nr:uncharacterized protein zgc:158701 [Myxocyprinus asiaticus]